MIIPSNLSINYTMYLCGSGDLCFGLEDNESLSHSHHLLHQRLLLNRHHWMDGTVHSRSQKRHHLSLGWHHAQGRTADRVIIHRRQCYCTSVFVSLFVWMNEWQWVNTIIHCRQCYCVSVFVSLLVWQWVNTIIHCRQCYCVSVFICLNEWMTMSEYNHSL